MIVRYELVRSQSYHLVRQIDAIRNGWHYWKIAIVTLMLLTIGLLFFFIMIALLCTNLVKLSRLMQYQKSYSEFYYFILVVLIPYKADNAATTTLIPCFILVGAYEENQLII